MNPQPVHSSCKICSEDNNLKRVKWDYTKCFFIALEIVEQHKNGSNGIAQLNAFVKKLLSVNRRCKIRRKRKVRGG